MRVSSKPVGSGRWGCSGFPAAHAMARTRAATIISTFAVFSGSSHWSIHGISPFRLKVARYQAMYASDIPPSPITPLENPESSHGPPGATPATESRISIAAIAARILHSGSTPSDTDWREGGGASTRRRNDEGPFPRRLGSAMQYAVSFSDVEDAAARLEGVVIRTPVLSSPDLNRLADREVLMKCENLQHVGAFKFRGASNAVDLLGDAAEMGVCTHSSGNHAQAVALAAKRLGVSAYIVMPDNAPRIKVQGVVSHGAEITFCEPTLEARIETAESILERTGATFIHPFENPYVIAGQGTAALELIQDGELDAVMAPIGGGGLLSGTSIATRGLAPNALIFGAEPIGADDAARSLAAGELIPQTSPETICDGLLTSLGESTWPILRDHLEEIVTVSDEEVLQAMSLLHDYLGMVIEPSGATCLAAVLKPKFKELEGIDRIGIILSGGNVDPEILPF